MALFKRMKRGPDKLVGNYVYIAHWPSLGNQPEIFRIVFDSPDGIGSRYAAKFTREEAQEIVRQFAQHMREAE